MKSRKKQFVIDIPYMHPICPLSLSHARIFILADTFGRYKKQNNYDVYMPIGIHFSGKDVVDVYKKVKRGLKDNNKTYQKFKNYYNVDHEDIKKFEGPFSILRYFSKKQVKNLKKSKTLFDFSNLYNTSEKSYVDFVRDLFKRYHRRGLIKKTFKGNAFDFDDKEWKKKAIYQLEETKIRGRGGKNMIKNSIKKLDSNWIYERNDGIGTEINGKIVNPMFDSQMYSLFEAKKIGYNLPVDVFFSEYHLSTWIATKIFFESVMLPKNKRTISYFLLGMAFTEKGEKISSSKGTGVLFDDLLKSYGYLVTRLSLILAGHPHKDFIWKKETINLAKNTLQKFLSFKTEVEDFSLEKRERINEIIKESRLKLDKNMEEGDFRKACIEALIVFPKKIKKTGLREGKEEVKNFIKYISYIFLP